MELKEIANQIKEVVENLKNKVEKKEKITQEEVIELRRVLNQLFVALSNYEGEFQFDPTPILEIFRNKDAFENFRLATLTLLPYLAAFDDEFESLLEETLENIPKNKEEIVLFLESISEILGEEAVSEFLDKLRKEEPQLTLLVILDLSLRNSKLSQRLIKKLKDFKVKDLIDALEQIKNPNLFLKTAKLLDSFAEELKEIFGNETEELIRYLYSKLKTDSLRNLIENFDLENVRFKEKYSGVLIEGLSKEKRRKRLVEIAKDSVFPIYTIGTLNNKLVNGSRGTCFVYKQVKTEKGYKSYLLTNLHNIQSIHRILAILEQNYRRGDNAELKIKVKLDDKEVEVKELYVPIKEIYEQLLLDNPLFRRFDVAVITVDGDRRREFFGIKEEPEVEIGEDLFAFGYPSGLNLSMAQGIASHIYESLDFDNLSTGLYFGSIQHTVLINPGNSGGPTVKENGEVVGISTFGLRTGVGLNFSIYQKFINEYLMDENFFQLFKVEDYVKRAIQKIKLRRL